MSQYIIDQTHTCSVDDWHQVGESVGRPVCWDFRTTGNLLWSSPTNFKHIQALLFLCGSPINP